MRITFGATCVAVVLAIFPGTTWCLAETESLPVVSAVTAVKRDLKTTLTLTAEFLPFQEVDLHAKVAGYVDQILVDAGDHVERGQLIATLEIPERDQELKVAEANVKRAEREITRVHAELKRFEAVHAAAHLSYTRLAHVTHDRPNLVAGQEVDDNAARDQVAEAQVGAAQAAVAVAEQQLAVATVEVEKARTLLGYARITAPFPGTITHRYAHTGSMIQQGTASDTQAKSVVRLSQLNVLRLVVCVPESAVPRVHKGTAVLVRVSSLGQEFPATVTRTHDRVETNTRTMEAEVDVANPTGRLLPGMYASAELTLEEARDAVAVPIQTVNRQEGEATVVRVNGDGKLEERKLELGLETATLVQVRSGLAAGDVVLFGRGSQYAVGQRVTPKLIGAKGQEGR